MEKFSMNMNDGDANALTSQETERYARHIVLRDIGGPGQLKLKAAKVLVIGAGGLGSPVLQYLAAGGVGTLGIVDDDQVSLSNLQRQIIHGTAQIGAMKTESAARAIKNLNPHIKVEQWPIRLSEKNGLALFSNYDLVADGSDNADTRYLTAKLCEELSIPLVSAAVGQFDGSLTLLKPYEKDVDGQQNPNYTDLFPTKPPQGSVPSCEEAGVMGVLTGIIGTLQAQEVIKEIVGFGTGLVGKILMVDSRDMRFQTYNYKKNASK